MLGRKDAGLTERIPANQLTWGQLVSRNYKGRGVKVALVDSGINTQHSHVGKVSGGVGIRWEAGSLNWDEDYQDFLGHGTAIAGIIRTKAPAVELYGVKIFEKTLNTYPSVVATGIKWAANQGVNIINLSLGTPNSQYAPLLLEACEYAVNRGCMIIAAAGTSAHPGWPAALNCVLGVQSGVECGWQDYLFQPGSLVEFTAHGCPRILAGRPQSLNLRGNSFATGHLTALAACLLERYPDLDGDGLRRLWRK